MNWNKAHYCKDLTVQLYLMQSSQKLEAENFSAIVTDIP
jgi:hypothetical protein